MVGRGLHRMDERRPGATVVSRPRAAEVAGPARLLRLTARGDAGGTSRARRASRHRGVLLLALLVCGTTAARTTVSGGARQRVSASSFLSWVGEPALDDDLDRGPQAPGRADLSRRGRPRASFSRTSSRVPRRALLPRRRSAALSRVPAE